MSYKPINIREILNSKINGPQESTEQIEIVQKPDANKEMPIKEMIPIKEMPNPPMPMKVHLDISSRDNHGHSIHIVADIYSQDDLQKFNALYEKHMPKKGLWGLW